MTSADQIAQLKADLMEARREIEQYKRLAGRIVLLESVLIRCRRPIMVAAGWMVPTKEDASRARQIHHDINNSLSQVHEGEIPPHIDEAITILERSTALMKFVRNGGTGD